MQQISALVAPSKTTSHCQDQAPFTTRLRVRLQLAVVIGSHVIMVRVPLFELSLILQTVTCVTYQCATHRIACKHIFLVPNSSSAFSKLEQSFWKLAATMQIDKSTVSSSPDMALATLPAQILFVWPRA